MRILQLGDTHLGAVRRAWNAPEGWSRALDHQVALERALAPALRGEVDLVVHCGDVFDRSRPPPAAVAAGLATLLEAARRCPVVVLAGNHDRRGLRCHLGHSTGQLHLIDAPTRLRVAGIVLGLVPHIRQAEDWALAAQVAVGGGVDLLVCHQGVDGARVPGFTFRPGRPAETLAARHLPRGVPRIASGHLHPQQGCHLGAVPVVYAGSTERTSFSEQGETKGAVLWEVGAQWRWRVVPHAVRPMARVACAADLAQVTPGAWVGCAPAQLRQWAAPIAQRGGVVALPPAGPRRDRRQLRLFG